MASGQARVYDYGSVHISLENCIIPKEKLEKTPSVLDGLSSELETDLRIVGCEYIQTAGILLKLPQVAMATGQVLFQRFFYSKSFIRHDVEVYAMACLFLAAKIEESPRRIRDVINVFHHIKQRRNQKPIAPMEYMGNTYFSLKNLVIKAERRILKELGFCVHIKHPHKVVITFLQVLESEKNQQLAQLAWNYMNDALRTNVFVRYQPETIACACIYLSARQLKIPLPSRPPWWELFDGTVEEIEDVCTTLLKLYQRPKVSFQTLNKAVDRLKEDKKKTESSTESKESRSKKKSSSSNFSQPSSPNSNSSPLGESSKSRSNDVRKNGSTKSESQEAKTTKKASKAQPTRKDGGRNPKGLKRPRSPGSDKSHSASGSDTESDDSGDSDSGSGSSPEDRKRKVKIERRQTRDNQREKNDDLRASKKLQKSKSDTNANRRARERSRSPRRRSRSRSRSRERRSMKVKDKYVRRADSKDSRGRNGDYKVSDKYDRRERSGAR